MSPQFTTLLLPPPGPSVLTYDPSSPSSTSSTNFPTPFLDALSVRIPVFVDEQSSALSAEIDPDDARSYHWIVYANIPSSSSSSTSQKPPTSSAPPPPPLPIATIRLIPPPHTQAHPLPGAHYAGDDVGAPLPTGADDRATTHHDGREPYIKLGRLAVLKEYRGMGLARRLVDEVLEWAGEVFNDGGGGKGGGKGEGDDGKGDGKDEWRGLLCLVHAQKGVERFYTSCGFVGDESMGRWWEEGIEHLGMWKRVGLRGEG